MKSSITYGLMFNDLKREKNKEAHVSVDKSSKKTSILKVNEEKKSKDDKKLLTFQGLIMVMVLILSIMLLLPEYEVDSSPQTTTKTNHK